MTERLVLVTGGAGFIGATLVRQLLRETDLRVVNVDALTYAASVEALEEVRWDPDHVLETVDIAHGSAIRSLFDRYRPEAVVHLAAESHVDRSIDGPAAFVRTNLVGTFTLLEEALRHWRRLPATEAAAFRFLHVSTDEVFGSLGAEGRFDESSRYDPRSPYAATKAGADHLVRAWQHTYGLPVLVTNCGNNYGPYQFPEKLIPLAIEQGIAGRPIPVYGRGEQVRDWIHVEDHARALRRVLRHGRPGETYTISAHAERRNLAVVEAIADVLDELRPASARPEAARSSHRDLITFVADRPGHDQRYAIDASRIRDDLGWAPRHEFDRALRTTVRWYLDNREWCDGIRARRYAGERLGLPGAS